MATTPSKPRPAASAACQITPEMVVLAKRMRFNPIRSLTPEVLSSQLDSWLVGHLRDFAITAEAIQRRDDTIQPALTKRLKAPARLSWSINILEGLNDAQKVRAAEHQAALQYFYDQVRVTSALEQNQRGNFRLLVRQMMESVAYRYAVHEIVWQPRIDPITGKPRLTAKLNYVPLWFFENTTSKLRFLPNAYGGLEGREMPEGEWLVTVGDGIMECLAVCYMFKQMSLKDWVGFNDIFGTPGIHALTDAAKDSPEWNVLAAAVEDFSQNWKALTNRGAELKLIEAKNSGQLPFPPLVERMDRAIATICRGADLSTMSAGSGEGSGASLQGDESDLLEEDDAETITEALEQLSVIVIKQLFGDDTPLAYVQIGVRTKKTTDESIKKMEFLAKHGVPVGKQYARQELGVPAPAEGEEVLTAPAAGPSPLQLVNAAVNDQVFPQRSLKEIIAAKREAFAPLAARLAEIIGMEDESEQDAALMKWQADLPRFLRDSGITEQEITAWINSMGTAYVSGAAEGREKIKPTS